MSADTQVSRAGAAGQSDWALAILRVAVPIALGAAHQAVAMLLFTVSLYLVHSLR